MSRDQHGQGNKPSALFTYHTPFTKKTFLIKNKNVAPQNGSKTNNKKLAGGSAPKATDMVSMSWARLWLAALQLSRYGKDTSPLWSTWWWPTLKDKPFL